MSNQPIEFKWEWPAGRKVESRLLLRIEKITPASKGLFGLGASPSLAAALPEATELQALVLAGPENLHGKKISVQLPGLEARKLAQGQLAGAGLIAGNAILVCVEKAPAQEIALAQSWLPTWTCQ